MGRIKTTAMKRLANQILSQHEKSFTPDFEKNKEALRSVMPIESKKIRNMILGYITKEIKRRTKAG